ncbi:hypothetical protein SDC9_55874 [bioreactor metagenome]|uniref:SpoVT-AbrB domain-containing protein n=1 Tax=bioreactor metagenome TaxID=1076179 RepID=A0A644X5I6_9ZZZZ
MQGKAQHYMSTVKVGPKGQVVIPKEIRDMFGIAPGDSLIIMADSQKGIAIQSQSVMNQIAEAIFKGKGKQLYPEESSGALSNFAQAIRDAEKKDELK